MFAGRIRLMFVCRRDVDIRTAFFCAIAIAVDVSLKSTTVAQAIHNGDAQWRKFFRPKFGAPQSGVRSLNGCSSRAALSARNFPIISPIICRWCLSPCTGSAPPMRGSPNILRGIATKIACSLSRRRSPRSRRDRWKQALGDRRRESDYRAFFSGEVDRLGARGAIAAYLPALVPGLAASATHGLMRLAYGVMREDDAEIAIALGYWAATYLELGLASGAAATSADPGEVLLRMRAFACYRNVETERDLLWHFMRAVSAKPEFGPVVDWLEIGPGTYQQVRDASLALFAGTMDFCALHALTGCHWLRLLRPALPNPDLALRYFWQAIASLYPKIGFPDVPTPEILEEWRNAPCPDWPEIAAAAVGSNDEHDLSLAFSAREEWNAYGDRLYQVVAARRLQLDPMTPALLTNATLADGRRADRPHRRRPHRGDRDKWRGCPTRTRTSIDLGGALLVAGLRRRAYPSRQDAARPAISAAPAGRLRRRTHRARKGIAPRTALSPSRKERQRLIGQDRRLRHDVAAQPCRHRHAKSAFPDCTLCCACARSARDLVDIQIVAFPQSGIIADPGVSDLLDAAIARGRRSRRRPRSRRHRRGRRRASRCDLRHRRAARRRPRHPSARSRPARLFRTAPDRGARFGGGARRTRRRQPRFRAWRSRR